MATKKVPAHKRKTPRGTRPVRASISSYKPCKPTLRVEGPDAATLLRKGLSVGAPVTLTIHGHVEEATAEQTKPQYGPQHSLRVRADRIEAPGKKKG